MVKNKCGFVGIGAYGGNQVCLFYKESYPSLFINTALTDLKSLTDVDEEYKYHVPGSEGCNKDRRKSKELFRQEIDNIINEIKEYRIFVHSSVSRWWMWSGSFGCAEASCNGGNGFEGLYYNHSSSRYKDRIH